MHDAEVWKRVVLDGVEHGHHPRRVNLNTDHGQLLFCACHRDCGLTMAETDVEHHRHLSVEDLRPIEGWALDVDSPSLDPFVELALTLG